MSQPITGHTASVIIHGKRSYVMGLSVDRRGNQMHGETVDFSLDSCGNLCIVWCALGIPTYASVEAKHLDRLTNLLLKVREAKEKAKAERRAKINLEIGLLQSEITILRDKISTLLVERDQ